MALKYSKIKDKSSRRLKSMIQKRYYCIRDLRNILSKSKMLGIEIPEVTINIVNDKIDYYQHEILQINELWNIKFNDKYKGDKRDRLFKDYK